MDLWSSDAGVAQACMADGAGTPARGEPALSWTDREPGISLGLGFLIFKWHQVALGSQGCREAAPRPREVPALGELAQPTSP